MHSSQKLCPERDSDSSCIQSCKIGRCNGDESLLELDFVSAQLLDISIARRELTRNCCSPSNYFLGHSNDWSLVSHQSVASLTSAEQRVVREW